MGSRPIAPPHFCCLRLMLFLLCSASLQPSVDAFGVAILSVSKLLGLLFRCPVSLPTMVAAMCLTFPVLPASYACAGEFRKRCCSVRFSKFVLVWALVVFSSLGFFLCTICWRLWMIWFFFLSVVNGFSWNCRAPLKLVRLLLSVLDGSVAAFSAGSSACKLGKLVFYARFLCILLFLLLMSRLLREQLFLLGWLEVLVP